MKLKKILALFLLTASLALAAMLYSQRPFRYRLGVYVTGVQSRSPAQRRNIEIAQARLDGYILKTGEAFSFNDTLGPYGVENGFVPERSFLGEQTVWSSGGGVCQLSSTLYNAARLAKLKMIERVLHSQAVESVPRGYDAAVAYAVADLKFQNNYAFPIQIRTQLLHRQLKVEIWGQEL